MVSWQPDICCKRAILLARKDTRLVNGALKRNGG